MPDQRSGTRARSAPHPLPVLPTAVLVPSAVTGPVIAVGAEAADAATATADRSRPAPTRTVILKCLPMRPPFARNVTTPNTHA